jgi:hypothetical protein
MGVWILEALNLINQKREEKENCVKKLFIVLGRKRKHLQ